MKQPNEPSAGQVVWAGPSWSVRLRAVTLANGQTRQKAFVDHPGSVLLVPLLGEEVVMLRQYRLALEQTILELPAGTREPGETFLACAQRELREETGYRATSFLSLGEVWPAPGVTNERMALFVAQGLVRDPLPADEDEQIMLEALPLPALVLMALDGRLEDAKSVIGVLRAERFLRGE